MGMALGIAALARLCHMTAASLVSLARRDKGLADVACGLGFIVASTAFLRSGLGHPRQPLLLAVAAAWGLRLAIHILVRNWGRAGLAVDRSPGTRGGAGHSCDFVTEAALAIPQGNA